MPNKRLFVALTVVGAILGATGALAQGHQHGRAARGHVGENNVLRFQLARLTPRGEGDYWNDKRLDFTGHPDDFEDLSFTLDYQRLVSNRLSVMLSGGFYEGSEDQAYLDFVDEFGDDIVHRTTLERAALTIGLLVHPFGRDAVVSPYLGGGIGAYLWRLQESGDFIDFRFDPPIFDPDRIFEDEGDAFGHYWIVGLEVPLSWSWAAFVEGRWHFADQELGEGFLDFGELDLSSREIGVGVSVGF